MIGKIQIRDYDTCPRCHHMVHIWKEMKNDQYYIICDNCLLKSMTSSSVYEVIKDWNRTRDHLRWIIRNWILRNL